MPNLIDKEKVLLAEGKYDTKFFQVILTRHLKKEDFQIFSYGGATNFKNYFPLFVDQQEFSIVRSLAIIRDADDNFSGAFDSIVNTLNKKGYHSPPSGGQILERNNLKIGIYIMPSLNKNGMLENLILDSYINANHFKCIEDFLKCVQKNPHVINKFFSGKKSTCYPKNTSKAKFQVLLASFEDVVENIGLAAEKGYVNFKDPCFIDLISFLNSL